MLFGGGRAKNGSARSVASSAAIDDPRARPRAVAVERRAAMPRVPEVEQHVARPRVEPARAARHRKIGQVRDAADVDDDAVDAAAEERGVERGHERRALPARSDVAAPEVGDHRHVGLLGDARRIVELQRPAFLGAMPDRLPVDARRDDVVRGRRRRPGRRCAARARTGPQACWPLLPLRTSSSRVAACSARSSCRRSVGKAMCVDASGTHGRGTRRELRQHGVDAVETRTGHHARVELAVRRRRHATANVTWRRRTPAAPKRRATSSCATAGSTLAANAARRDGGSGSPPGSATVSGSRWTLATRNS